MIFKAMIKFWSKFQIQILLQFYWRAEKVAQIKIMMVMFKSVDKSLHLITLHIFGNYLVLPWLRFKYAK